MAPPGHIILILKQQSTDRHVAPPGHIILILKQQSTDRHVAPPGHIIMIPSRPVFAIYP